MNSKPEYHVTTEQQMVAVSSVIDSNDWIYRFNTDTNPELCHAMDWFQHIQIQYDGKICNFANPFYHFSELNNINIGACKEI